MTGSYSSSCLIEIDGRALPEDIESELLSATVDTSQRLPDMIGLRFRDPDRIILTKSGAAIGCTIKASIQVAEEITPTVLFEGEITALEAEFDSSGTFTIIRGYDRAHRLFRGRRTVSYVQMTASDIASQVARRVGLTIGEVTATSTVFPQVSQVGQTDWELLQELARDTGFEVLARAGKFSFTKPTNSANAPTASGPDSTNPHVLELDKDLLRFRSVVTSAQQCSSIEVRGWDVETKIGLTATAPAVTRSAVLPTVSPQQLAGLFGSPTFVATGVPYRTQAEVDESAKALADSLAGTFAEFEGLAYGDPQLRAGVPVTLAGLGAPFDGKYTLTTTQHRFDPCHGYTTAITVSGKQDRSLLGLASGGSPASRTATGPAIAQVSDANDPESKGRVRLVFPWLSDDYVSDWARTVQPGAGKDRGWTLLPEVGDEVLVCFELGDFDRPYVMGGLFNGIDTMPTGTPDLVDSGTGGINRRSLVSRLGHRLDLLDQAGQQEGIRMSTTGDKFLIRLDPVGTKITVHADGQVLVEGKKGITIDADTADLDLKGGQIKLTASKGVTVDGGPGAVTVKTSGGLSLSGTTAKLEGKATTEVKGGAMCSVSAAIVKIN